MCYMLWNGVFFFFFFFFCSLCELNILRGSGCFVDEAFELEIFLYLIIYFGYVAGQEYFMYV